MTAELYDLDAERQFLGAVWHSQGAVLDDTSVTADDFVHAPHQALYKALERLRAHGAPVTPASVSQELGDDLSRFHGAMVEVATSGTVPQSAGWHANILLKLSAHRRVLEAAARITQAANGDRDPDELADFARQQLDAADREEANRDNRTWADVITGSIDRWTTPVTDAIATGWHELDDMLSGGGLRPGHLTVVGARPGVGKSLIATMLAGRTAAAGHGVYFASVEMSTEELTDRIAAAATGVNLADLTNRTLTDDQLDLLRTGVKRISPWPLHLDDRVSTMNHIRRGARRVQRSKAGLGLILADYLQLLSDKGSRASNRQEAVAELSRSLKLLGRQLNVPVVVLSQLKRPGERSEKRPIMTDLRESGGIEQDADEIVLLHRDDDDPDLAGQIELNLAKNRHGRTGSLRLRWQPQISRITDLPAFMRNVA